MVSLRSTFVVITIITVLSFGIVFFKTEQTKSSRLQIVCTTSIIYDTVQAITQGHSDVSVLMGPGVDPHTYKATPANMRRLISADLIFYNGLHLEGKMAELLGSDQLKSRTCAITDAIPPHKFICTQDDCKIPDPHVWFDVELWIQITAFIVQKLCSIDQNKTHQQTYIHNASEYYEKLSALNTYLHRKAAELSPEQKILVTAHDAFNYFGRAYAFQLYALQGISTDSDIGTKDIQRLANFIVTHNIKTIFVESSISPRGLRAVQQAVESRGFTTRVGPELYSDALGTEQSSAGSYIAMLTYTMDTIVDNLK